MTEREKLIETIRAFHVEKRRYSTYSEPSDDESLADALKAAGIGDVNEYKHRAEVAERALRRVCHIYYMGRRYTTNSSLEPNEWSMYDDLIRLAERELEEAKP